MGVSKRRRIEPTHDWQLRPLMLFDVSVAERAAEMGTSTSTLYRRLDRFAEEGLESLFDAPAAKRKRLPPAVRRRPRRPQALQQALFQYHEAWG